MAWVLTAVLGLLCACFGYVTSAPTLQELGSIWVPTGGQFSSHTASLQLDSPTINNFYGSVGTAPAGKVDSRRPVDLVAVNSLELPPFAGCGNDPSGGPAEFGCGSLSIDGSHVDASASQYHAYEAGRRGTHSPSGVSVLSTTRLAFESNTVLWNVTFTNPTSSPVSPNITFGLAAMVNQYASVQWVESLPLSPSSFKFSVVGNSSFPPGVLSEGLMPATNLTRPASAMFGFSGSVLPDHIVAGSQPSALFDSLSIGSGESVSIRLFLVMGETSGSAMRSGSHVAASFDSLFSGTHDQWEQRWQAAFTPSNTQFSGWLPSLTIDPSDSRSANITRVYYMSALSVLSLMRTNLPIVAKHVFVTSSGDSEELGGTTTGIGGASQWFWDEALSSVMISLLVPDARPPTMQAWMTVDPMGQGSNWYQLDCSPPGTTQCSYDGPGSSKDVDLGRIYCYNIVSLFQGLSNHLRVNNDTAFLNSQAGSSGRTVDENLEAMALFFEDHVIPNPRNLTLVDYGPDMDGFSPTYQHVKPGCSQGNTAWMLRQVARLRELQGDSTKATAFRKYADAVIHSTMEVSYDSQGYFNILYPPTSNGSAEFEAHEYRHVVDFFSIVFGFCGDKTSPCSFNSTVRAQMSSWFKSDILTQSWIRATSPACNCSNTWTVGQPQPPSDASGSWPGLVTCQASREDHGTTGAYTAWPALAVEAMCYVDGNCTAALDALSSFASNTVLGPFGQANAAAQDMSPPYTPFNDEPSFKPADRRYDNVATGAFVDAVIRGLFGYHPDMVWPTAFSQQALDGMLFRPSEGRGFSGHLSNLRTPWGTASITSDETGVRIGLD